MNPKTKISLLAAAFSMVALCADEAKAPEARAVPVPGTEVKARVPATKDSDEVKLAEFDDSAEAAKARPEVKLAPLPSVAAPSGAGTPAPETPSAQVGLAVPEGATNRSPEKKQTGAQIAAKYLLGDETALVDITSDDATLSDILRQFRKTTGANIIYAESSNLQQRVSIHLKRVPWLEAMTSILSSRGFRVESSGGIHFIKEDKTAIPIFTRSFQLKHASADELADLFNNSYGVKKDGKLLKGIATSFQGANTVVVTAEERTILDCEKIVTAVDKAVPQIYIEARFLELSNEALHKLGVKWDKLEGWSASVKELNGGMEYNNGHISRYNAGSTTTMYTPKVYDANGKDVSSGQSAVDYVTKNYLSPSSINAADGAGRSANSMGWLNARGFSGQLSADEFKLTLSAFEQLQDARIFSNPKIIVSNGKEALVDMTTKFPNVKVQATRNTSNGSDSLDISTQLEAIPGEDKLMFAKEVFFSWGITLSVKPRISPDGLISVEIIPTISQLDDNYGDEGFYQVKGGDSSAYSSYPIIQVKRLTTDFTMKDGATAVIGGLSKTEEGDIDSGIPYLRKIPWVGPKLFGWKSRGKVQKEIIVFVTVGIADPANLPEDIGLPQNAVRGREYVEGRAFEPGKRPNAANEILSLDYRPLDGRVDAQEKAEVRQEYGTVTITPSEP